MAAGSQLCYGAWMPEAMETTEERKAYDAGGAAFLAGLDIAANPHPLFDDALHEHWRDGYVDAASARQWLESEPGLPDGFRIASSAGHYQPVGPDERHGLVWLHEDLAVREAQLMAEETRRVREALAHVLPAHVCG